MIKADVQARRSYTGSRNAPDHIAALHGPALSEEEGPAFPREAIVRGKVDA